MLRRYAELKDWQDGTLLATEYGFSVPLAGTWDDELGEPHRLNGSVDRLALTFYVAAGEPGSWSSWCRCADCCSLYSWAQRPACTHSPASLPP
jgi:hypothetical protein